MNNRSDKIITIAVPTNDGKTIFPKMLGMAKYFYIFEKNGEGQFDLTDTRSNPFENSKQRLKTYDVYSVISDCEVIIAAYIGKKGIERLKEKGMQLFFRKGDIQEALNTVTGNE
jgi:predicted Fe-Mo cluster-binding NifX family protein